MPINLQNDENIQGKWGPSPKLDAAPIGATLAAILHDRLERDKMLQGNISGTIKNIIQSRQGDAYLQAARDAGIMGTGDTSDLGGIYGATLGGKLADQIREQQEQTSRSQYEDAIRQRILDKNDPSNNPNADDFDQHPVGSVWVEDDGSKWYMTPKGRKLYPTGMQSTTTRPENERQSFQTENQLQNQALWHAQMAEAERKTNEAAGKANVPYSGSAEWAKVTSDLARVRQQRENPPPDDQSSSSGAGSAPNLAPGYGRPAGESVPPYVAGKKYGGRLYLGGDPNDRNNCQ